jgi:hypothetical protein
MNEMKPISNFKNNLYQVAIILLLAYAAFSTAMKDLDRLQEVAGNVQEATSNGLGGLAKVYLATKSLADGAELARAPQGELTESPRVDIVAAGGSVALAGFDDAATSAKLSCPVHKRTINKTMDKQLNWNVVAQVPRRVRFLRNDKISINNEAEIATLIRRGPRLRAIINELPKAGRDRWSNVDEFKSLSEVIGFGFKVANVEDKETERRVETIETPAHYLFEMKPGISDSDSDNLETHE